MQYFVFRNQTVERFFAKECVFSGYDDISEVPSDAHRYIWFYQLPIKYDQAQLANEVMGYVEKLRMVLGRIDTAKLVGAFTMVVVYNVTLTDSDSQVLEAVEQYNKALRELASTYPNLRLFDISEFTRQYPTEELMDWKFYFMSQMIFNPRLAKPFREWMSKKWQEVSLLRKKCLVLDLDNTLWGGVLGEDGVNGIALGGDYPGKAFHLFQEALAELGKAGVLLAVCSKNNEADVLDVWEKHPSIVLRKSHFVTYRINWEDKASNMQAIAKELNIGLDSMVFVDDNPTERALIRQLLPMVAVPDFPEHPYELPSFFGQLVNDYFKVYALTEEDRHKTAQYQANAARANAAKSFVNFDDYLRSLDIHLKVDCANTYNLGRIAQMTQKTNQFNLTTHRYLEADLRKFLDDGWRIWCLSVSDKYGDSGITGCIMVHGAEFDTMLLSCRILGKGIENAFIGKVLFDLQAEGMTYVSAKYVPTSKNKQVEYFYDHCGFQCVEKASDGKKTYRLDLSKITLDIADYYHFD